VPSSISIGDIAKLVREPGEDLQTVTDRLRGWVKEGLLKPERSRREAGQHRRFPERAIVDAAILSRLAHVWGIWATKAPVFVSGALDKAVQQLPKARAATGQGKVIYLLVWTEGAGTQLRVLSDVQYIDAIESRPVKAGLPKRLIEVPSSMSDGFLIDLSSLFSRIGVPLEDVEMLKELTKRFPDAARIQRG
jgi:hypothetical protein